MLLQVKAQTRNMTKLKRISMMHYQMMILMFLYQLLTITNLSSVSKVDHLQ